MACNRCHRYLHPHNYVRLLLVQKATLAVAPTGIRIRRRILKIGSGTVPTVSDNGRPSIAEIAVLASRPRPRKRARSVSNWISAIDSPSTTARCAAQTGESVGERSRRVARRAPIWASNSVCTNILEKAGCAASDASSANTTSAYEVSSISRTRVPRFETDTRRTSASSSGETATSSVVVRVPSWLCVAKYNSSGGGGLKEAVAMFSPAV